MSSFISSSNPHRRYVLRLLALTLVPLCVFFGLAVWLEPLSGDLTRIGSYAERDFGWKSPQLEFVQPLAAVGKYDRYHDVVVLGDSFSIGNVRRRWQNYLVAATGWSVVTLDIYKTTLAEVLDSQVFRATPPRVMILESVERHLPSQISRAGGGPCGVTEASTRAIMNPASLAVHETELSNITRRTNRNTSISDVKLGFVLDYLWRSLQRYTVGKADTATVKVELVRPAPFSSAIRQAMLVYEFDIGKVPGWRRMGIPEMLCEIDGVRDKVEANGQTRFVLMVAPDKLTAYSDFVRDAELRNISALAEISSQLPDIMPRFDQSLIAAIRNGEIDVYLPNDTHWGSTGYRIVAETLQAFLLKSPHRL